MGIKQFDFGRLRSEIEAAAKRPALPMLALLCMVLSASGCHADGLHHPWFPVFVSGKATAEAARTIEQGPLEGPKTLTTITIEPISSEANAPGEQKIVEDDGTPLEDLLFYREPDADGRRGDAETPRRGDADANTTLTVAGQAITVPNLPGRKIQIRAESTGGQSAYEKTYTEKVKADQPSIESRSSVTDLSKIKPSATTLPALERRTARPGESTYTANTTEITAQGGTSAVQAKPAPALDVSLTGGGGRVLLFVIAGLLIVAGVLLIVWKQSFALGGGLVAAGLALAVTLAAITWLDNHPVVFALVFGGVGILMLAALGVFIWHAVKTKQDQAALAATAKAVDKLPAAPRQSLKSQIAAEAGTAQAAVRASITRVKKKLGLKAEEPAAAAQAVASNPTPPAEGSQSK